MRKFPRIINKKWTRYSKIEKVFLFYIVILFILELFLPFIKIDWTDYSFINSSFILSSIILFVSLLFIFLWNISYTIKWFVKEVFGFEYNEAFLNFVVLFLHASLLIQSKWFVSVIAESQSASFYQLLIWFYVLWFLLVLWLVWNLFIAINLSSSNRRKLNYSKLVPNNFQDESADESEVKSLFDKDNI